VATSAAAASGAVRPSSDAIALFDAWARRGRRRSAAVRATNLRLRGGRHPGWPYRPLTTAGRRAGGRAPRGHRISDRPARRRGSSTASMLAARNRTTASCASSPGRPRVAAALWGPPPFFPKKKISGSFAHALSASATLLRSCAAANALESSLPAGPANSLTFEVRRLTCLWRSPRPDAIILATLLCRRHGAHRPRVKLPRIRSRTAPAIPTLPCLTSTVEIADSTAPLRPPLSRLRRSRATGTGDDRVTPADRDHP